MQCCLDATSWSEHRPPSPNYQNQYAPDCQSPSQLRRIPSHSKLVKLGVTQIISREGSVLTLEKASSTNQTSHNPGRQLQQIGLCLAFILSIYIKNCQKQTTLVHKQFEKRRKTYKKNPTVAQLWPHFVYTTLFWNFTILRDFISEISWIVTFKISCEISFGIN